MINITILESVLFSIYISIWFVSSFYLYLKEEEKILLRNHPIIILKRFKAVGLTCVLAVVSLIILKYVKSNNKSILLVSLELINDLGLWPKEGIYTLLSSLLLVSILFMGSIVQLFINKELPFQQNSSFSIMKQEMLSLAGLRAYIVGPFAEEFVFRCCIIWPYLYTNINKVTLIWFVPMFFGAAHLHHAYENIKLGVSVKNVILSAIIQFSYTTLFGMFSTFLFLRTVNFWSIFLCHSMCNMLGLPNIPGNQSSTGFRIALILLYIIGLFSFFKLLYPLTQSINNII